VWWVTVRKRPFQVIRNSHRAFGQTHQCQPPTEYATAEFLYEGAVLGAAGAEPHECAIWKAADSAIEPQHQGFKQPRCPSDARKAVAIAGHGAAKRCCLVQ
jgi:hypothetical protein